MYQANIAQRFVADLPAGFDPFALYRRLRETNPATFGGLPGTGGPDRRLVLAGAGSSASTGGTWRRARSRAPPAASTTRRPTGRRPRRSRPASRSGPRTS
ncbi:MAG: hypothetical protein PGN33_15840 [Methylobacterium radiotolerans]